MKRQHRLNYLFAISAVVAGSVSIADAQLQVAGSLLVNVDATGAPLGPLASITNNGTAGGYFEARGDATTTPVVGNVNGNGSRAMIFDGGDYLQHVATLGGPPISAPSTLTGPNPTLSIEAWVLNPGISQEETVVSWGHRGGNPDGSNMSLNYGWDDRWGAAGHWGGADIGWDPCCDSGTNPQGVPKSGVWHHLAYTFDGTNQFVYADGVLKKSEAVSLNIHPNPAIVIASQMDDDTVVTGGLRGSLAIARLRVHSEALTASQVANNYAFEAGDISNGGSPPPAPIHRYSFNNSSGAASVGAVVTDSVGGADGTVQGAGGNFTGSRLTIPGGSSATAAYVDLPNGLLSTNGAANGGSGQITVEGWVKNTGSRNWGRVYDFGNGSGGEITGAGNTGREGRDYWFLSGSEGTNPQRHNTSLRNLIIPSGSDIGVGWDTANANRDYHFAVTWDEATGQIRAYENGTLVSTLNVNPATDKFSTIEDVNVWLGRSNWTDDENFQGEYDEFRIYNRVLTPDQVAGSYALGPEYSTNPIVSIVFDPASQTIPESGSALFSAIAQGTPAVGLQWYKNTSPLIGSNGNSIAFTAIPTSESGAQYFVVASNNVGGTSYFATSQVATLTVLADTNPPTLTRARVNSPNTIELIFSEPLQSADVIDTLNYVLTGTNAPAITNAAVGADATRVVLSLDNALTSDAFYTVTVSNLRDVSTGANVITAPGDAASFWNYSVAGMTHRYTFNTASAADAAGLTIPDVVGSANGRVLGNGASLTGSRVVLPGGSSATAPYIDLPNGLLSQNSVSNGGSGQFTIEGWAKVTAARNWARLVDFGTGASGELTAPGGNSGGGSDYLFYSASDGQNANRHVIVVHDADPLPDGSATGSDASVGIDTPTFGSDFQFVVTWDELSHLVRVYENGVQVGSFNTGTTMNKINDVNVWLGRSQYTSDENMHGEFDEVRIFNTILSPAQIAFDKLGGADNNFGAPTSIDLIATNSPYYTNSTRLLPVLVNFSNSGTQNVAGLGLVTYSSSDSNVLEITSDGVLHTHGVGTATATVSFAGLQDSEEISVTGDTTPPLIVGARANGSQLIEVIYSEPVDPGSGAEPLYYTVTTPTVTLSVTGAVQFADQSRILLQLDSPMPSDYITVAAQFVSDMVGNYDDNGSASFIYHQPLALKHRYTFNTSTNAAASGVTISDAAGNGDATLMGSPVILSGNRVLLGGGASGSAGYIDLPNGLLSINSTNNGGSGQVTIEGWVKITGNRTWSRIFDFGSSGSDNPCCPAGGEIPGSGGPNGIDYLMLTAQVGGDIGTRQFELNNRDQSGHGAFAHPFPVSNFNQDIHYVVTWDERTGQLRYYENGVLVDSANTVAAMSEINDVNVWLGRSNWTGDQNTQGEFDDFRLYNRVLTTNEIQVDRIVGPDNNFGAPQSLSLNMANVLHVGQAVVPQSLVTFSNVTNADFSFSGVVRFDSSNPSVVSADGAGVLHPLASGTATITQSYAGFANTITVTVTNEPPVAGTDGLATSKNVSGAIDFATMLANDSDPDGGVPLSVTGVSATSTNGGTVTLTSTNVIYTPVTDYTGPDLFTYTVSDFYGASSVGQVVVYVVDGPVPDNNSVVFKNNGDGSYYIAFRGTPGTTYRILRADDVTGPWTTVLSTQTAPASGIITYTDSAPPAGHAFYKVVTP